MTKTVVSLPTMYADHHVTAVRRLLLAHPGVQGVVASSAFLQAEIEYDPGAMSSAEIRRVLAEAGYPEGDGASPALPRANGRGDLAWERLGVRVTRSHPADPKTPG